MNDNALIYEYSVVRYVPHVEREEFINVGLLMMCKRCRWIRSAMHIDTRRLLTFDPDADIDTLQRQLAMFNADTCTLAGSPVEERFRWLSAVKSSVIQTSRPHPGMLDCDSADQARRMLDATFDRLLLRLVK